MNWSVFTTVLNNIQEYVRKYTPVSLYVPVVAFAGAWVLVGIALFGFETPLAYWNQLSLGLKAVLIAVIVFAVLLLAYLLSSLRILITQLYEGRWPIPPLTNWRRGRHLKKWQTLNRQWRDLAEREDDLQKLKDVMVPPVQVNILVPTRDLPIYHIIRSGDLTTTPKLPKELEETWARGDHKHRLLGHYTIGPLSKDKPVPRDQVRAGPWPGYLEGRAVVSVPLVPHAALGTRDNVQAGDLIHLILTPKAADHPSWRRRRLARPRHLRACSPQVFRHVLVLGVESAKEVVPVDSTAAVSRDLVVLVVALPTDIQPRLAELLDTCEVKIVRALESWNRWIEGRVPRRLSLTEPGVTYKLPPGGVQAGDVIDIQGIATEIPLKACFVYAADRRVLTVAIPRDAAASYDSWKPQGTIVLTPARLSDVPFLKRDVKSKRDPKSDVDTRYVLVEDDLYTRDVLASDLPAAAVIAMDKLVNRRALMDMAAGTCIRSDQVEDVTWLGGKLDHTRRPEVLTVTPPAASEIQVDPGDVIKVQLQKTNPESQDAAFEQCFVYAVEPQKDGSKKLTVAIPKDARLPGDLSDSSIMITLNDVPILKHKVGKDQVLVEDDLRTAQEVFVSDLPAGAVTKLDDLVNRRAKQCLHEGAYVCAHQIEQVTWPGGKLDHNWRPKVLKVGADVASKIGVKQRDVISVHFKTMHPAAQDIRFEPCYVYAVKPQKDGSKKLTVAIPNDAQLPSDASVDSIGLATRPTMLSGVPILKHKVGKGHVLVEDDLRRANDVLVSNLPGGAVTELDDLVNRRAKVCLHGATYVRAHQIEQVTWPGGKLDHTRRPEVLTLAAQAASKIQVKQGDVIHLQLKKPDPDAQHLPFEECYVYKVKNKQNGNLELTVAIPKDELPRDLANYSVTVTPAITITPAVVKVPVLKRDVVLKDELICADNVEKKTFNRGRVDAGAAANNDEVEWHHAGERLLRQTFILKNKVKAIEWRAKCEEKSLQGVDLKVPGADRLQVGQVIAIDFGPKSPGTLELAWTGIRKILRGKPKPEPPPATAENTVQKIVEPCFIERVDRVLGAGSVTMALAVPKGANWPSQNGQTVSAILSVGSEYKGRLQILREDYEKERNKITKFMTALFTDHWSPPKLPPLQDLTRQLATLRQDMDDYDKEWPGLLEEIYEEWMKVRGTRDYVGLSDLRDDLARAIETRRELLEKEIRLYYPGVREEEVMATALGNILKATERYPLENYGIEADLIWPRLRDALQSDTTKEAIAESKNQLDMLLMMSFLSWIFWISASLLLALFSSHWMAFLACFWGAPLLGLVCYKAAIQKALDYGENLKTIYDLHRWDLLKEFNLDLGKELTPKEEKEIWENISRLLARGGIPEQLLKDYKLKLEG